MSLFDIMILAVLQLFSVCIYFLVSKIVIPVNDWNYDMVSVIVALYGHVS